MLFASTGTAQHLDYNGGAVLGNPAIHNVYMDFSWDSHNPATIDQASIDGFTTTLVNSTYLNSASQYGVGSASFTGSNQASILCPPPIIAGVTDFFAISAWMQCMTVPSPIPFTGTLSGVPAPDDNTVYAVYVPSGTQINDVAFSSCGNFGAYHFLGGTLVWAFVFPSPLPLLVPQRFTYTVVPVDCGAVSLTGLPSQLDGVSYLATHEIIEASTDPVILTGWIDNSTFAFNADILKKGEAADICSSIGAMPTPPARMADGLLVAPYWSNAAGACVPDVTPPVTTAQFSPPPNLAGWNNTNVTVTFTSTDNEPGGTGVKEIHFTLTGAQTGSNIVSGSSASVVISTEGSTIITFFGIDNAGNQEVPNTITVRIDRTPPSVTCGSPDGLWHANDVAIPCTASDSLSGLANPADASFNLTTSVPVGTETASAFTNSRTVFDVAGNSTTQGPIGPNMVDKKPPTIIINQPMATQYVHSATLTLNYTVDDDGGSGVSSFTPTMNGSPTVGGSGLASGQMINLLTTLPLGQNTFAITATDKVNNMSSASVTFTIIVTPQSIIADVNQLQAGGAISANIAAALLAKLNNALKARNAGHCGTAANIYSAFINQVMAQTGKGITPAAAAILIADAQYLIAHCP